MWQKKEENKVQKKRTNKVAKVRHTFIQESCAHTHIAYPSSRAHTQHTCKSNIYIRSTNTRAYVRIVDLPLKAEIQAASRRQRKEAEGWRRSRRRCVREWRRDVRRRHASRTLYDAAPPTDNGVLWRGPTTKGATSDKHRPFQHPRVETVLLARMPDRERCDVARCCLFDFPHFMVSVRLLNGKAKHDHASVSLAPPIDTLRRNGTLVGLGATSASATLPGGAATSSV